MTALRYGTSRPGLLSLGVLLALTAAAWSQDPLRLPDEGRGATQEGVEPLTRGPIHEAFALPPDGQPQTGPVIPRQPPAALEELPPDQKPAGDNVQWVPGYWGWDEDRSDFIWVSGFWRLPPPGRQWVPGRWTQVAGGSQWVPGMWMAPASNTVEYLPPPPEPIEVGPSVPAPDDASVYVPGCWVYRETRYAWRPGHWIGFHPGWVWAPAHYNWTPCGWVFVDGYWDYDLSRRGLLFAPVYVNRSYYARPGWFYRPAYAVFSDFLFGALFLRPSYRHYYFGDYFDAGYRRRGFVPWVDYRIGRSVYDPLYSYYRVSHRNDRSWDRNLNALYAGRSRGDVPRPPRTIEQQNTLVRSTTVNNTVNVQNLAAVGTLTQLNRQGIKLEPVTRERRLEAQTAAVQLRQLGRQREKVETQLLARDPAPLQPRSAPRVAKLDLPPARISAQAGERVSPPPPPVPPTPQPQGKKPKPAPRPETKPDTKPQLEPKPAPRPELKPDTKPRPEVKPAPRPEPKPEPKPQSEPKPPPRPEIKPAPRPEPKPETRPRPEVKPAPRPESKPPSKPEGKPPSEARILPRATPPAPRPEVKPSAKNQPLPEVITRPQGSQAGAKPEPRPQSPVIIRSQPGPEIRTQAATPRPEARPAPPAAVRPEPRPAPAPPPRVEPRPPPSPPRLEPRPAPPPHPEPARPSLQPAPPPRQEGKK